MEILRTFPSWPRLAKKPSAWLPVAMSAVALALLVGYLLVSGPARETDEGAVAHLWQLLMVAQVPIIGYFVIAELRRSFKPALGILATQVLAALLAVAPVYFLKL